MGTLDADGVPCAECEGVMEIANAAAAAINAAAMRPLFGS